MTKFLPILKTPLIWLVAGFGSVLLTHPALRIPLLRQAAAMLNPVAATIPVVPRDRQILRGGQQVRFNQQVLNASWLEWRSASTEAGQDYTTFIGISDQALASQMGLELLSNPDPEWQPVQWFALPAGAKSEALSENALQSLDLPALVTTQNRYLAIQPLAETANWDIQIQGQVLAITTPPAQIQSTRWSEQPWGQRIVVELDRPTPWQMEQTPTQLILNLDQTSGYRGDRPHDVPATNAKTSSPPFMLRTAAAQTSLQIPISQTTTPQIATLGAPPRLVIDLQSSQTPPRGQAAIAWIPGLSWQQDWVWLDGQYFPVTRLTLDPKAQPLQLRPIWAYGDTLSALMPLLRLAPQRQAIGAINAGFFNRNNQLPLGAIRDQNRWISGPILNRGAIAWNDQGEVVFDRLTLQEQLLTGNGARVLVLHLNSGYVKAGFSRYTPEWGAYYQPLTDRETIFTIQGDRVTQILVSAQAGTQKFPIPQDGYLLTARGVSTASQQLPVGVTVTLEQQTFPATFDHYPYALGAGPLLLRDRQIVLNPQAEAFSTSFAEQAAVRSAIGQTATKQLLLLTVHASTNGQGPTLMQLARLLQALDAVDALNLDGGSSSSLVLGDRLLNRPASTAARIQNALGIFLNPASP